MLLTFIDESALGRLDYATMNQQALMECVVAQFSEKSLGDFRDVHSSFLELEKWEGVECDADGHVRSIDWFKTEGTINLQWLPQTLQSLSLTKAKGLFGCFECSLLPRSLQILDLNDAMLSGTFSFEHLPRAMRSISIHNTNINGALSLQNIPENMHTVEFQGNAFENLDFQCHSHTLSELSALQCALKGTLRFHNSPPALERLDLQSNFLEGTLCFIGAAPSINLMYLNNNAFCGPLHVEDLPAGLQFFDISVNTFSELGITGDLPENLDSFEANECFQSGLVDFIYFPPKVDALCLSSNNLKGTVVFAHMTRLSSLSCPKNLLTGSLSLRELPDTLRAIDLSENKLSGSLELTSLPECITDVKLFGNEFSGTIDLGHLPKSLWTLHLHDNHLSGAFSLEGLPKGHGLFMLSRKPIVYSFNLSGNRFVMETLVVPADRSRLPRIDLRGNAVGKVIDTNGVNVVTKTIMLS